LQLNPASRYVWFSSSELFGASCEILLSSYPMLIPLNMLCFFLLTVISSPVRKSSYLKMFIYVGC
jgi:hypothetical protein